MRALLPLLLIGCLVRDDLYQEARERLNAEPHVWADCDGDGWGDPAYVAHLPEVEPECDGTWVDNGSDCDDGDTATSYKSGALCADEIAEDWFLYTLRDRELLLIEGGPFTLKQAEDRCSPLGWGGELAQVRPDDFDEGLFIPPGFSGWVGASRYDEWNWDDGSNIDLPFCSAPPNGVGLVLVTQVGQPTCLEGPAAQETTDLLDAPGFLCQRPL